MKCINVLYIFAYICLVSVTTGTHIGQRNNQEGPEATEPNEPEAELKAKKQPENHKGDEDNLIIQNLNLAASASSDETQVMFPEPRQVNANENEDYSLYDENGAASASSDETQVMFPEPRQVNANENEDYSLYDKNGGTSEEKAPSHQKLADEGHSCWMSLNAKSLFKTMDDIDNSFSEVRKRIQNDTINSKFNEKMSEAMFSSGAVATREFFRVKERRHLIPAGLNLGGFCMMRMANSILFFHRMKLRNDTRFRFKFIENDLGNMVLTTHLSLNDLHLRGAFERSLTDQDISILYYKPTFGEVDILLKDVDYNVEGRYRLIKERLVIEMINSEIIVDEILMTYISEATKNPVIKILKGNLDEFIDRMKTDLDKWLKDYFNDFLIYTVLHGISEVDELEKYDKQKAIALNQYMDDSLDIIRKRIRDNTASNIKMPTFTIKGIDNVTMHMHNGVFRGLDSIYRRSVATTSTKQQNKVRKVDSLVGFSDLKVIYQYETVVSETLPALHGTLILSANELSAHLSLSMVKDPETVDIDIDFLDQTRPESLTVEGPANTVIAKFKHILEHQITALMSNVLYHGIKELRLLPKCEPFVPGQLLLPEKLRDVNMLTDLENTEDEDSPSLRSKRHSLDLRKKNKRSRNKRASKKRSKHSNKKSRSYKKKNRGSKRKHRRHRKRPL